MGNITKLCAYDLGTKVNNKEISCREVMQEFQTVIEEKNKDLNAFTYTKFDEAFEEADVIQSRIDAGEDAGPFAGCPLGLKDFLPSKKGWTSSHGGVPSLVTEDEYDTHFYTILKKLGCIAVGKTNAPAFGFRGLTDNKMYGYTRNPYNLEYNSGGSSGGSASAVGGHLVPLALCGDLGGSTRIPASWCNCFGYKPSARIVPDVIRPDGWAVTHPYAGDGVMARSVKDVAITFNNAVKFDLKDPINVPLSFDFMKAMERDPSELRVGFTYHFNTFPYPDPEIIKAVNEVIDALRSLGVQTSYVQFPLHHTLSEYEEAWLMGSAVDTAIDAELTKDTLDLYSLGDELPEEFYYWNKRAFNMNIMDFRHFNEIRTDILDAHAEVFNNVDIIIAPVTGCLPVKNSTDGTLTQGPSEINGVEVNPLIGFAYTYFENMIGFPAASFPWSFSVKDNLPIGVQVIARRYRDEDIFTICRALEKVLKAGSDE